MITSGLTGYRSTGATLYRPFLLAHLAKAYAELEHLDDAWRCIDEVVEVLETTKEIWCEAEVNRIAGEVALLSPERDVEKAVGYFERALAVARQQQAKSWELRAAMSMARLWRDQGKWQGARELLAPVYGWFTEGFDTRDLTEAKALLEQLAALVRSSFRQSRLAHALNEVLSLSQKCLALALCASAVSRNRESRVKRESGFRCQARLIDMTNKGKSSG
jgi:predicted ATPase